MRSDLHLPRADKDRLGKFHGDRMTQVAAERRIPALYLALAGPVAPGDETLWFDAPLSWTRDDEPLRPGQYLRIGWELRIILEVGERWVRVSPVDDQYPTSDEGERMEQVELDAGWFQLTPSS
jgi:hypothetical protein